MIERCRTPSGDNYSYVIYDEAGGSGCLVDPVAGEAVESTINKLKLEPVDLVNTHGHGDHTGGNKRFRSSVRDIVCHPDEEGRIQGVDRTVSDGDSLKVGALTVEVLHTPGHTSGSICLKTPEGLISGDTVFLAGCGNPKFGGDTQDLFESFRDRLKPLDHNLTLYPGHDYAKRNLRFAKTVEPENEAIQQKLNELTPGKEPTSSLGDEHQYNPFFRFDNSDLRRQLDGVSRSSSDWDVFRKLRNMRNKW